MVLQCLRFYMQVYIFFLVISLLKLSNADLRFQCPVQSHWKLRAETSCDFGKNYFCLYNKNEQTFMEFCKDDPDFDKPGQKLIVAGSSQGTLQGTNCTSDFYQPFKFLSSGNSRCVFEKSYCNEEGQIVQSNGTTRNDRSCRCDYTRGYAFKTRPTHPCLCVPSKEDCSCYHKTCPTKHILSPEYECLNENEWKLSFNCDSISTAVTSKDPVISLSTDDSSLDYHVIGYRKVARVAVLVVLMIMLSVSIILLALHVLQDCFYRTKPKRTNFEKIQRQDVEEQIASIIEANDFEKQNLKDEIRKLKDKRENVPHHVLELQKEILQHWSNVLNKFVFTKAAQFLYQHIRTKNAFAIVGPTGTGKSAYAYYLAFRLKDEYDYTIVPVKQPSDILQYYEPGTNQVFVIDDFIGKYAFDEAEAGSFGKIGSLLQKILSKNDQTKVILTCRKSIWHPKKYERFGFSALVCDLHSKELRLTLSEKRQIFESYINRGVVEPLNDEIIMMYTFFPSLCSIFSSRNVDVITTLFTMPVHFIEEEMNNYEEKSHARYISLAVLAIKQKITKKSFLNDIKNDELITTLLDESGFQIRLSKTLIISHLMALTDTYVKVDNDCLEIIHKTMQNIVLYCIAKTFLISVLKYCNSDVFKNQVRLACVDEEQTVPVIKVKSEHEVAYFTRLTRELEKGQYSEVFRNNQNESTTFRKKWLVHLNKIRQTIPSKSNSVGLSTVLHIVSSLGYEDYVSHFIKLDTRIVDKADANGNTPLHLASLNGHLETVKCLVEYSRNVHILNNDKLSPFIYACENNEIEVVKYLTSLKGDLVKINETYETKEHRSVLHIACLNGLTQIVRMLLDHYANINMQDEHGLTPLHLTCLNGQYNTTSLLLANITRPCINALDMLKETPIYLACIGKYSEIVKLLIEYNADFNQSTLTGSTPLHAACEKESIDIVNVLIENLSDVNVKDKTVESPLHVACRQGNELIVNVLINHSALVNSKTKDKVTPLHVACSNGHLNVVDILLKNNANYKQRNKNGWTALLFSCANGNNDIVKMLLNLETDVNISNSDGITPLMLACKGNHITVVKTLLASKANVNQCNNLKSSALEYTCTAGNIDIVHLLLEHYASINLANISGITPLHTACMNNHEQVVKALIEKRADIDSVDVLGETPLYKSCFNGNTEIVAMLLNNGATINLSDTSGQSPASIAKEKGFRSIVELLNKEQV